VLVIFEKGTVSNLHACNRTYSMAEKYIFGCYVQILLYLLTLCTVF